MPKPNAFPVVAKKRIKYQSTYIYNKRVVTRDKRLECRTPQSISLTVYLFVCLLVCSLIGMCVCACVFVCMFAQFHLVW